MGIRFRVTEDELMSLLALILPLALFLSAVVMFASTFARSFKEAQSYIGILILLPMLPGIWHRSIPCRTGRGWRQCPFSANTRSRRMPWAASLPPGLLRAGRAVRNRVRAGLVAITSRLLKRESIIFGR